MQTAEPASRNWRPWSAIADVFDGPGDPDWIVDRAQFDDELHEPFTRSAPAPPAG